MKRRLRDGTCRATIDALAIRARGHDHAGPIMERRRAGWPKTRLRGGHDAARRSSLDTREPAPLGAHVPAVRACGEPDRCRAGGCAGPRAAGGVNPRGAISHDSTPPSAVARAGTRRHLCQLEPVIVGSAVLRRCVVSAVEPVIAMCAAIEVNPLRWAKSPSRGPRRPDRTRPGGSARRAGRGVARALRNWKGPWAPPRNLLIRGRHSRLWEPRTRQSDGLQFNSWRRAGDLHRKFRDFDSTVAT